MISEAENDLGHCVAYTRSENTKFVLLKNIIGGKPVRTRLIGNYSLSGHQLSIEVDQQESVPFVSSNIFLDGRLVASRTSPFDESGLLAASTLRSLVVGREEDPSRLDVTIADKRSPYPFAAKMLIDFLGSSPDEAMTEAMINKMKATTIITRPNDYRLK